MIITSSACSHNNVIAANSKHVFILPAVVLLLFNNCRCYCAFAMFIYVCGMVCCGCGACFSCLCSLPSSAGVAYAALHKNVSFWYSEWYAV